MGSEGTDRKYPRSGVGGTGRISLMVSDIESYDEANLSVPSTSVSDTDCNAPRVLGLRMGH